MPAAYSSEDEQFSSGEEELSEEVRVARRPASMWAPRGAGAGVGSQQPHPDVFIAPQELAAALELQRERVARGGGAAAGPAGSDEDEDGEGEQGGAQPAQRPAIYNVDAIHDKLEDIGWVLGGRWLEGTEQKQQQCVPACLPGSPFCRPAP